jgi:uncharacterized protein (TIGR02466 family)
VSDVKGTISNWFPVQFAEIEAPQFISVGKNIFESIDWSSIKYDEYNTKAETTYYSMDDLPFVNGINELKQIMCDAAEHLAAGQGVDITKYKAIIPNIWMSNMRKGSAHLKHAHGGSMYSGTYYVKCPEGSGNIRFYNPSTHLLNLTRPPISQDDNAITSPWVDFKPIPGKLMLWNSYVEHEVLENTNTQPRISISFNINFSGR